MAEICIANTMRPSITGADEFWTWRLTAFIASFSCLPGFILGQSCWFFFLNGFQRLGGSSIKDDDSKPALTLSSRSNLSLLLKPYLWIQKLKDQCHMYILLMNIYRTTHWVHNLTQATLFIWWLFGRTNMALERGIL